jgi:hypothetical protein
VASRAPGSEVAPAEDAYGRLGYLIAAAPDRREVESALAAGLAAIRLEIASCREAAVSAL